MGKKPLKRLTRHGNRLTDDQIFYLKHNFCLDGSKPDYNHPRASVRFDMPFRDEAELARAWKANKEHVLGQVPEPREGQLRAWAEFDRLVGV